MPYFTPSDNDIISRLKTIVEGCQVPDVSGGVIDWTTLVSNKWSVFGEWPESFDIGADPTILQSDTDTYTESVDEGTVTKKRVNSWIINPRADSSVFFPQNEAVALSARPKNILTRSIGLNYFYQFGGLGEAVVNDYVEAVRREINKFRKLGFDSDHAEFVNGHNGLQMPVKESGDFRGTILYIRAGYIQVRLNEPLN